MGSLLDDQDIDERNSPTHSSSLLNDAEIARAREAAILDQQQAALRDDLSPEGKSLNATENLFGYRDSQKTDAAESTGQPSGVTKRVAGLLRKRFGVIGLITTLGLGGGLLVSFFGPASMLVSLSQNFTLNNDTSSSALERRLFKVLNTAFSSDSASLCASGNKIKCKMGRISNNTLRKMAKKGVVPVGNDKKPMDLRRTGYAKENPKRFEIEKNGKKIYVDLKDLPGFLGQPENKALAGKIYGRRGLINMQVRAWHGKQISKFFNKFGIRRDGGIISKAMKSLASNERVTKLKESLPKMSEKINGISGSVSEKVKGKITKASGRAGPAYGIAVAGCASLKAPKFIAAGVAGIQLLQILPIVSNFVLSPGSKLQASGIDPLAQVDPDDISSAGEALTKTTKNKSGKLTSALDSRYLLNALGVSNKKVPLSKFTPGYSILSNPAFKVTRQLEDGTEGACNTIMSPVTMWSMAAVDAATTVAASFTVIGGVIKIAGSWAISAVGSAVGGELVKMAASAVITQLAENKDVDSAVGEELGDIIGIGATAFFASGAMSRFMPGLSMSKLFAANELKQQQEDYQKELDIASLSPFDTSSPYTFMGSIVSKLQTNMLRSGGYNNSIASILSNVVRIPSMALSFNTTANAATGFNVETCGYAKEFDQETGDPATTPAINMAGMPCTGLTPEQDAISMDEAINLLGSNGEGWIDENADIPEGATIEDLVSSGYIKADTPMADFIESCGDASSGNYLFDSAGCVMADGESAADSSKVESELSTKCESIENNTGETESSCYTSSSDHTATSATDSGVKNSKSLSAIVVFLLDYQVSSILSGEDDEEVSSSQSADTSSVGSVVAGDIAWPVNQKLFSSHKYTFLKGHGTSSGTFVRPGGKTGIAADLGANSLGVSLHEPIYSMLDGEVIRVAGGHAVIVRSSVPGGTVDIAYAHGYPQVAVGDVVKAGQQISGIGNNGNSSGAHLHVDMNYNQQQFCPQDLFIFMNDNPGKLPDFKTLVSKASSSGNCARSGS